MKCGGSGSLWPSARRSTVRLQTALLPVTPLWLADAVDAAAPRWQCRRWWMTPCWTSLRGASHNRSFQKALLHTAAWGAAWKVISINSQPSSSAISKHNLELRNIIVFLPFLCSTQCNDELAEWCSFDEYDSAVMIIWTWSSSGGIGFGWKTFCKKITLSYWCKPSEQHSPCLGSLDESWKDESCQPQYYSQGELCVSWHKLKKVNQITKSWTKKNQHFKVITWQTNYPITQQMININKQTTFYWKNKEIIKH